MPRNTVKSAARATSPRIAPGPESAGPKPGDKAPDFKVRGDTGETVALKDFRGRKLVLYFYPKDNTPGCTKEACAFRDGLARLRKAGAEVVGVSADSAESHRRFKDKHRLNFPLLADEDRRMLEAYGVWKEKSLYGRRFMGIERTTFVIDEQGRIRQVFPKVKVDGHFEEVLAALGD